VNSNSVVNEIERPVRINRIVSVILNGVLLNKLAVQHNHDVNAMADSLMNNLSGPVQRNIRTHEMPHVGQNLKAEIGRRINVQHTF
jgi:energy-converting hydrogenase Eha subunit F